MKKIYLILLGLCLSVGTTWGAAYNSLYIVCSFNNWDTTQGYPMNATMTNNYFYWIGYLANGEFKFNPSNSNWNTSFGSYSLNSEPAANVSAFASGYRVYYKYDDYSNFTRYANNIVVSTAGYYYIKIESSDGNEFVVTINPLSTKDLSTESNLILNQNWDTTGLGLLKTALGSNSTITNITFENAIPTNWAENYFENINSECTITTNSSITLNSTESINIPRAITATGGYTYQYTPSIYADGTNGWESICLPFQATTITASKDSEADKTINFFTNSTATGDFWLKKYNESTGVGFVGFDYAPTFEANTPYIIAIPGDKWGTESDLTGYTITFKGTGTIVTTEASTVNDNYTFKGNYASSLALDETSYALNATGNNFAQGPTSVSPFQAYMSAVSPNKNVRSLSIGSGGATGLEQIFTGKAVNGLSIISAQGSLIINTDEARTVQIYGMDGCLIRTAELQEGNNTINGLASGIYLINNQKAIVK